MDLAVKPHSFVKRMSEFVGKGRSLTKSEEIIRVSTYLDLIWMLPELPASTLVIEIDSVCDINDVSEFER